MLKTILSRQLTPILRSVTGIGAGGLPIGEFESIDSTYYTEPVGGSNAPTRYQWDLDGQDDFYLRGDPDYGSTTTATVECVFVGRASPSPGATKYLIGRHSFDRFFLAARDGLILIGNGGTSSDPAAIVIGDINYAKLTASGTEIVCVLNGVEVYRQPQLWTGVLDSVGFAIRGDSSAGRYNGPIQAFRVTTDAQDDVYLLSSNGDFELPIGEEDANSTSKLTLQNGEPSGSDFELVTRKSDNSGWTGDGANEYDYAAGAIA